MPLPFGPAAHIPHLALAGFIGRRHQYPAFAAFGNRVGRHPAQVAFGDQFFEGFRVATGVATVFIDGIAHHRQRFAQRRFPRPVEVLEITRHGNCQQGGDHRHDDQQLDQREAFFAHRHGSPLPVGDAVQAAARRQGIDVEDIHPFERCIRRAGVAAFAPGLGCRLRRVVTERVTGQAAKKIEFALVGVENIFYPPDEIFQMVRIAAFIDFFFNFPFTDRALDKDCLCSKVNFLPVKDFEILKFLSFGFL